MMRPRLPGRSSHPPPSAVSGPSFLEATLPHLDVLHRLARNLGPSETAEDIVQETYLRAFQTFDREPIRDVRAWLITICLNVARNEQRRHSRHPEEQVDTDLIGRGDTESATSSIGTGRSDFASEPARLAELADRRRAVRRALAHLPEPQRACIVLVDMVGYSAQEAADLLGCPRGTVLARVHRGRRRLAVLLESEGVTHEL